MQLQSGSSMRRAAPSAGTRHQPEVTVAPAMPKVCVMVTGFLTAPDKAKWCIRSGARARSLVKSDSRWGKKQGWWKVVSVSLLSGMTGLPRCNVPRGVAAGGGHRAERSQGREVTGQ